MSYNQQGGPQFYAPQPQHPVQPLHVSSPPSDSQRNSGYSQSSYDQQSAYNAFPQHANHPQQFSHAGQQQQQQQHFPGQEYWNAPAAQMGLQVGQSAMLASQEYVNANMSKYLNISTIRRYFSVTNSYVLRKLFLTIFPWRHHPWHRQTSRDARGEVDGFLMPRDDINAPDMYIPIMAIVTYILLNSLIAGIQGSFQADLLGQTAGWVTAFLLTENLMIKAGCYLLNIPSTFFLDLVAYTGYKYIGIIITNVMGLTNLGRSAYWLTFLYTGMSVAFFMLRSLRSAILQGAEDSMGRSGQTKVRRVYFLAGIALAQLFWMYLMLK